MSSATDDDDSPEYTAMLEKRRQFQIEFKALVRKYVPLQNRTALDNELLMLMQESTSVYNPFIWDDKR